MANEESRNTQMNRRLMLLAGSSALATTALMTTAARAQGAAQTQPTAGSGKPNIVVIWGDDVGISNLSCYSMGVMGYRTPNIDRIAREGMLFTDYYGEQSCTAGRSAFITGRACFARDFRRSGCPARRSGSTRPIRR